MDRWRLVCALTGALTGAAALAGEPAEPADTPASIVSGTAPEHPDGEAGERQTVRVLLHLDAAGAVVGIDTPPDLDERFRAAIVEAIGRSTFAPPRHEGHAIAGDLLLDIVFEPPAPVEYVEGEAFEVIGHADAEPLRAISDTRIDVADVAAVAPRDAAAALQLAPGVFLTRVGGDAEPVQVFLRGFDARHGQDIAFSLDGMPLNQVGNPHGHGLVDLRAILPETLASMRVIEGPFDPAQGDFAVAGSVSLKLGLPEPGFMLKGSYGSFNTARAFVGWRHPTREGFFVAGSFDTTRGYGANRSAKGGGLLLRLEGGDDVHWHVLAGGHLATAESAGLVRAVDVAEGRVDLYGTQDEHQGGHGVEGFIAAGAEGGQDDTTWRVHASVAVRQMQLRTNYTGFLLDDRRPGEPPHDQRGDLLEQSSLAHTLALDGQARRAWPRVGLVAGALEGGVSGRVDLTDGDARRLRDVDLVPYRTEVSQRLVQGNIAPWVGGSLSVADRLTLSAGTRFESFLYALSDRCAAKDLWFTGTPQDDTNCPAVDRVGPRLRDATRTAAGFGVAPRGSIRVDLDGGHALMASVGRGIRSLEAGALSDQEAAPFGGLLAGEVGWQHQLARETFTAVHRLVLYTTRVARDLLFDEESGSNVVAGETIRYGATAESEVHAYGFTERTTIGWTYAVYGDELPPSFSYYRSDRQPGQLIPYVPPFMAQTDLSYAWSARELRMRTGLALRYVAPRPLPQSERSEPLFNADLSTSTRWRGVEGTIAVENLFNRRNALAEYNFSSWFPDVSGAAFPTRVPSRSISPGSPFAVSFTLTLWPESF